MPTNTAELVVTYAAAIAEIRHLKAEYDEAWNAYHAIPGTTRTEAKANKALLTNAYTYSNIAWTNWCNACADLRAEIELEFAYIDWETHRRAAIASFYRLANLP